ncbi:methyl-accepting chemotaxis protein [Haloimpatiens massiliensis]|uniref:methyl-accepting chemotaxis protein n=1 Tax=Haloimpatiens massiliensis TaxID=1658110 RepID=UPI0015E0EB6E|nr:methyl-accepting chemotaxis protein [Haloimpatiens massiliensis]
MSNSKNKNSIKYKVVPIMVLAMIIPIMIMSSVSYNKAKKALNESFDQASKAMVKEANMNLDEFLSSMERMVNSNYENKNFSEFAALDEKLKSSADPKVKEELEKTKVYIKNTLDNIAEKDPVIKFAYIGTRNKATVSNASSTVDSDKSYDPTSKEWYKKAVEYSDGLIYTEPYNDAGTGSQVITIARAFIDAKGVVAGVFAIDVDLDSFVKKYNSINLGQTGNVFIVDEKGKYISNKNLKLIGKDASKEEFYKKIGKEKMGSIEYKKDRIDNIASFETNGKTGWKMILAFQEKEIGSYINSIRGISIIVTVVCAVFAVLFALRLSKYIIKPLKVLESGIKKAALGDLTESIDTKGRKDEFGSIGNAFNKMVVSLKNLLENIKTSSDTVNEGAKSLNQMSEQVSAATVEVAKTIDEIAKTANEQAKDTEKGVSKAEILSTSIGEISERISVVTKSSKEAAELNEKGLGVVSELVEKTRDTSEGGKKLKIAIDKMDEGSKEIGNIVNTISAIAEQTNLLALNASIEAARAGEAGRGFAVVAEEIRKLAEGSQEATEQIKNLISDIQDKSSNAVISLNDTEENVSAQEKSVSETGQIFRQISNIISKLNDEVERVKELNEDMISEKEQIVNSITNISASSEETSAATEEVSASTEEILATIEELASNTETFDELADKLLEEVNKFNI